MARTRTRHRRRTPGPRGRGASLGKVTWVRSPGVSSTWSGHPGRLGRGLLVRLVRDDLPGGVKRVPDVGEPGGDGPRAEPEPVRGPVVTDHPGPDEGPADPPGLRVAQADVRPAAGRIPRRGEHTAPRPEPPIPQPPPTARPPP